LNVLRTLTCVRVVIRIFRVTPQHPFIATATSNEAAFKLHWLSGEEEPYTWNVDMLQKYFV
jgi:hypothetical protein